MSFCAGLPHLGLPPDDPRSITDAFAGSQTSSRKLTADDWLRISDQQRERKRDTPTENASRETTKMSRRTKDRKDHERQELRSQHGETQRRRQKPRRWCTQPVIRSQVSMEVDRVNEDVAGGPVPKAEQEVFSSPTVVHPVPLQERTRQVSESTTKATDAGEHPFRRRTAEEWMCVVYPIKRRKPPHCNADSGPSAIQGGERDQERMKDTRTMLEAEVNLKLEHGITGGAQVENGATGDITDMCDYSGVSTPSEVGKGNQDDETQPTEHPNDNTVGWFRAWTNIWSKS
ncbi:hypothetical protein PQX77_013775 [Marasmius sp. AFHP31]|nr:hypothetical protein PQX77_013775 [Marasmius sp. AFHP31]